MADSNTSSLDSTILNNDKSVPSSNGSVNVTVLVHDKPNKRTMTSEQYRQLTDKLCEIEQIKCEEYLVHEQLNRLNSEREHLQDLLNLLYAMNSSDKKKTSRYRQRRLQKS